MCVVKIEHEDIRNVPSDFFHHRSPVAIFLGQDEFVEGDGQGPGDVQAVALGGDQVLGDKPFDIGCCMLGCNPVIVGDRLRKLGGVRLREGAKDLLSLIFLQRVKLQVRRDEGLHFLVQGSMLLLGLLLGQQGRESVGLLSKLLLKSIDLFIVAVH